MKTSGREIQFCSFFKPNLSGRFFVIIVENAQNVSLESFVFIPFASTVLSNRSWRTSISFTPSLSLASSSLYVKSIRQISFFNLANAFILLNLRVARVNLYKKVLNAKNCLTFDIGTLDLTKSRTDPWAQPPCVYSLCSFWLSDFEKDPASSLQLWHSDSESEPEIHQWRQVK